MLSHDPSSRPSAEQLWKKLPQQMEDEILQEAVEQTFTKYSSLLTTDETPLLSLRP